LRAVTIEDGKLVVREHADPVPGTSDLLVRVRAAGLNGADIFQVRGAYPAPPGSPADIPGMDLAGEVVDAGPLGTRFKPGDRVMGLVGGGAQAELAVVHERFAMPVPDGLPMVEAGGFPEIFVTAHDALFTQSGLSLGERVLITGAAGGVGTAAVQLAAAAGASVVASVRDPEHRPAVAELGAEQVVAPDEVDGTGPFDVILELVGAPNLPDSMRLLASGGRVSVIGTGAGSRFELDLRLLMSRRARIMGSTLRSRPLEQKADAIRRTEAAALPGLASRRLRVPVTATYPLERAEDAYERFTAGGKLGKVILET
jgi:NADPH:quinone reductase